MAPASAKYKINDEASFFCHKIKFILTHQLRKRLMEDKVKFEIEFPIQASPSLLYQYMSSPSGMSEWFADNVNSRGEYYTFIWNGSEEKAKLLGKKMGSALNFDGWKMWTVMNFSILSCVSLLMRSLKMYL